MGPEIETEQLGHGLLQKQENIDNHSSVNDDYIPEENPVSNLGLTQFPFLLGNLKQTATGLILSSLLGIIVGYVLVLVEDALFIASGTLNYEESTVLVRDVFYSLPSLCVFIFSFDILIALITIRYPPYVEVDMSSSENAILRIKVGILSVCTMSDFNQDNYSVHVGALSSFQQLLVQSFSFVQGPYLCIEIRQKKCSCCFICNSHTRFVLRDPEGFLRLCKKLHLPIQGEDAMLEENEALTAV